MPDDEASPGGDGLLTPAQMGEIALAEWYRRLRKAGMPVLGAAAFIAATMQYGAGEPQGEG